MTSVLFDSLKALYMNILLLVCVVTLKTMCSYNLSCGMKNSVHSEVLALVALRCYIKSQTNTSLYQTAWCFKWPQFKCKSHMQIRSVVHAWYSGLLLMHGNGVCVENLLIFTYCMPFRTEALHEFVLLLWWCITFLSSINFYHNFLDCVTLSWQLDLSAFSRNLCVYLTVSTHMFEINTKNLACRNLHVKSFKICETYTTIAW